MGIPRDLPGISVWTLDDCMFEEAVQVMTELTKVQNLHHSYDMQENCEHLACSYVILTYAGNKPALARLISGCRLGTAPMGGTSR